LKFKLAVFYILIFFTAILQAQWKKEWFPSGLNIQPFTANFIEPRGGSMIGLDGNKLRLDIGTSKDIFKMSSDEETISFGADVFTFTRLRSQNDFKFPVETVDYLFGINAGYKKVCGKAEYGLRFRFSHISAHLVDGKYESKTDQWMDGRTPITFSKEFFELFPYYRAHGFRVYAGLSYIIHILPGTINKGIYQLGFDYFILPLGFESVTPFIAYDFKLNGVNDVYDGNNIVKIGLKFGQPFASGFSILFSYISGRSIHGELYDINENYANIGFNLDL